MCLDLGPGVFTVMMHLKRVNQHTLNEREMSCRQPNLYDWSNEGKIKITLARHCLLLLQKYLGSFWQVFLLHYHTWKTSVKIIENWSKQKLLFWFQVIINWWKRLYRQENRPNVISNILKKRDRNIYVLHKNNAYHTKWLTLVFHSL